MTNATNANAPKITSLTIEGLDFWTAASIIDLLSGEDGTEDVMAAFEDWRDENAAAFALKYAREGRTEDAETIMGIYDGDLETDPDSPCFDPDSDWRTVKDAINEAKEEHAPAKAEEILEAAGYERDTWDDAIDWLDGPRNPGWDIVEEAARLHSIETAQAAKYPAHENLFADGRIYGMATALATAARIEGADAAWWDGFISDFAADNYEDGARVE